VRPARKKQIPRNFTRDDNVKEKAVYEERRFSQLAKRAWSSCSIATNFTPIPFWASLHCTMARARIWPTGASSNSWINVPAGGGSVVRIHSHPEKDWPHETPAVCCRCAKPEVFPWARKSGDGDEYRS